MKLTPPRQPGLRDRGVHALYHSGQILRVVSGQQQHKLIAALARHGVGLPHAGAQPVGHALQQAVAEFMAVGVVDEFELIKIDKGHGNLCGLLHRVNDGLMQAAIEQGAIRQPSQCVVVGLALNLRLVNPPISDVFDRTFVIFNLSRRIAMDVRIDGHPDHFAVVAKHLALKATDRTLCLNLAAKIVATLRLDVNLPRNIL